jgi:hypothetical protein
MTEAVVIYSLTPAVTTAAAGAAWKTAATEQKPCGTTNEINKLIYFIYRSKPLRPDHSKIKPTDPNTTTLLMGVFLSSYASIDCCTSPRRSINTRNPKTGISNGYMIHKVKSSIALVR